MRNVTIYRTLDGTPKIIFWKNREATNEEINPEPDNINHLIFTKIEHDVCDILMNASKERVVKILDTLIF